MLSTITHLGAYCGLRAVAAAALIGLLCTDVHAASKAAIITGNDSPQGQAQMDKVAAIASPQYSGKGYGIVSVPHATKAGIIGALSDPSVTHVNICAHGVEGDNGGFAAKLWIGPGLGPEAYLSFQEVIDLVPLNRRCAIKQVVFNCCGQLKPEWQQAFPCATIHGWTTSVTFWSAKWDQWWHGSERTTGKGSRGDTGPGLMGLPFDGRIAGGVPKVAHPEVPGFIYEKWWDAAAYPWHMPPMLASGFGDRRFNFIVGDSPADEIFLGTIDVLDGEIVAHSDEPIGEPDFVLRFTHDGFETAIGNIDTLPSLFMTGMVVIEDNTTMVPPTALAAGSFAVLFGFGAVPPPGCFGDADGSGAVDFGDITSVLANWGQSGPVFRPGDADGSGLVDFGDVTTVLANWGSEC